MIDLDYHGASFDDREDTAKNSRADKQLFLLSQMKMNMMKDHR